jgi:multidrug resistance efflux pump
MNRCIQAAAAPSAPASQTEAQSGDFIDEAAADIPALTMMTARAEQAEEELRCADAENATLRAQLAERDAQLAEAREEIEYVTVLHQSASKTVVCVLETRASVERELRAAIELGAEDMQRANRLTEKLAASEARVGVITGLLLDAFAQRDAESWSKDLIDAVGAVEDELSQPKGDSNDQAK